MAIVSDVEIRLRADIARLQQDMNAARRSVDTAMGGITQAAQGARNALASIVAGLGARELAGMVDQYVKFTSQLKLATQSQREYNAAYADVKRIASVSAQGLQETGVLYARIANGVRELGVSQKQMANITETVNLSLLVSGATANEAASAQLQLSQAFASGTLRGEEFNAVNEAAPRLMLALADGIGVPVGALKKMAEEGLITSDIMANVLPRSLEKLREEAKSIQTISGAFTLLKNNVIEFVGSVAESSGAVSAISTLLTALAKNLDLVAGALLTVAAVKIINFFDALITKTAQQITANRALVASNLATAQANATATAQSSLLANARLAEIRAATVAADSNIRLALTTNGLIPAQAAATRAAAAHTAAMGALAVAQGAVATASTRLAAVVAFLGGPIGALITVLGIAATAWMWYQSKQSEANAKAAAETEASTAEVTASLEKQNAKLRERIKLQQQAGASDALTQGGVGADQLADTLTQINELKARGATLDASDQIRLISLQGLYNGLNKEIMDNIELKRQEQANGQAAKALVDVRERLNGVNGNYLKDLGLLKTALDKGAIDQAEYTDLVSKLAKETYKSSEAGKAAEEQNKKLAASAKEAAAEAKRQADAYRDLMYQLGDRVAETAREAAGLSALSTAEQAHLDLTNDLVRGKIKLTKVQEDQARALIAEAGANEVLAKSNQEWDKLQQRLADNSRDLAQERYKLIDAAKAEALQNELLVETFGMSEEAVTRLTASRLLDQEAQRLGRDLTQEEIEDLQRVIKLKERSAKAVANKRELEEAKQFWTDIDKTARDTFVSIADGGKNTFQRLKDTAKNVFFDWLYQQTLKKWIINIVASVSGAAGISGIAQAAGAGGGGIGEAFGLASSANSLYGALTGGATLAGGLGTGFLGSLAGGLNGAGIGSGLTSAIGLNIGNSIAGVVGSNVASGIATGLSGLAAAAPWAAGALAVYTIGEKAFGHGPKEFSGNSSIEGMFGASGLDAKQYAEWTKKGGWFRSDKSGRDPMELGAETSAALTGAYDAIKTSSAQYAEALGLNADSIMNRTQAIKIDLTKDEAANQKAIADFFAGVADTVASEILPNIAMFQQAGESAAATLQRVSVNFQAVDQILSALGTDSQTAFRAVGVASLEARERLVALTGGIEAFAQQASFFNENFLTQAEQIAIIQGPLNKRLEELGYAGITTTEQFKTAVQGLVSSGALATEEGAKLYAGLLAIAPQFKTVADYLQEVSDAAAETAKNAKDAADALAAQALADNESLLRAAVDSAFDAVGRAVDAQRDQVTKAYEEVMTGLGKSIESVTGRVSDLTRLSDALRGAMGVVQSDVQQAASRGAARAQVQAAIAIANASGVLPSADDLAGALSTLRLDASDQFSSLADYQREVARTNNELATLGGLTDKQLTDAQKQLAVLEAQKAQAELQYQDEMMRLDGILEWAQAEVDAINGVDRSVQSVVAAIAGLKVASQALNQGATPANPTGGNLTVEQLYRSVLGREGEAAGIAYWKNVFGAVVDAGEYQEFIKGAQPELELQERQRRQAEAANMATSRTMSSNTAISTDMSAMEAKFDRMVAGIEQFASQFNQVTAGGNAVLTEPA